MDEFKQKADEVYFNSGEELVPDNVYDYIAQQVDEQKIGHPPKDNKVKLPFKMPSLDKLHTEKDVDLFVHKMINVKEWIIQPKLDGVSSMVVRNKLYTRGDGTYGSNITPMIPYLNFNIYDPIFQKYAVRGEIIINKDLFSSKYGHKFSNPRNFVSGVVNTTKNLNIEAICDLQFIAYELIDLNNIEQIPKSQQFELLQQSTIKCIDYILTDSIDAEFLSCQLNLLKEHLEFEVDGVVISPNRRYSREEGNPSYVKAFKRKINDLAHSVVEEIIWTYSKDKALIPKLRIKPTPIMGTIVRYIPAYNAKNIVNLQVGPGAVIIFSKSGDVMPTLVEVVKKVPVTLPSSNTIHWDKNRVNIIEEAPTKEYEISKIDYFVKQLKLPQLGEGTINTLYEMGYTTVLKLLEVKLEDLLELGMKISAKIYNSVQKALSTPIPELLSAMNAFGKGIGSVKIRAILKVYPNLFDYDTIDDLHLDVINGIAKATATHIKEIFPQAKEIFFQLLELKN